MNEQDTRSDRLDHHGPSLRLSEKTECGGSQLLERPFILGRCLLEPRDIRPRNLAVDGVMKITVQGPIHWDSRDIEDNYLRSTWPPRESEVGSGAVGSIGMGASMESYRVPASALSQGSE